MGDIYYISSSKANEKIKSEPTKTKPKANRKRQVQIVIRVSDEERELLQIKIKESGKKQAEYLRQAVLNKKIINTDGIKEVVPELNRIGNNFNQLVRNNNAGYNISNDEFKKALDGLSEVWKLLIQKLEKEGR
jgi:hypothetical protein